MAHLNNHSVYFRLTERLNRFPQGAHPSELLIKILKILFTEKEAELASALPIKPFTARKAARIWKMNLKEARKRLDDLASKAILLDINQGDEFYYVLPPPMAGFFEFSLMRIRKDIDQKTLARLFYEYLNIEEDFIRNLFLGGQTQQGRAFVHEPALSSENALHVLDYERAAHVIETASTISTGICYCRHKMSHVGKDCSAPKNICMTFNTVAESLIRHGNASGVDRCKGIELLHEAYENNLVQFGENVQCGVNFLCNCCGCCCEAMLAARRFAFLTVVHTTNFIPEIQKDLCNGCGKCVSVCPVEAMALVSANDHRRPRKKKAWLNEPICLGCGICARVCSTKAISLRSRPKRVITPVDSVYRTVLMAVERGKLQHLIFDNKVLWSHRAMAAVLGAILKLPPVKMAMATDQFRSRYLNVLTNVFRF
jgi:ferredoxin